MTNKPTIEPETAKLEEIEQAVKDQIYVAAKLTADAYEEMSANTINDPPRPPGEIQDFTGRTERNFEAAIGFGTDFFQLATRTSQIWLQLAQKLSQRNFDALSGLATAKSLQEVTQIQRETVHAGLEDIAAAVLTLTPSR